MAINENTEWPNRNALYLAASGGGKSQCIKQSSEIPKSGVRVIGWDPDRDHDLRHYTDRRAFVRALKSAIKSGRGFRLGWSGDSSPETFQWWCRVVWAALDGNVNTYLLIEELADVESSPGKASPPFGQLLRRCRKYGGILHAVSQRGTEIPKTCYTQCEIKYVGIQRGPDVKRMAKECGVFESDIKALKPLEFIRVESPHPNKKIKLRTPRKRAA